eukprot:m.193092 g.193092  ORF g.193092 m.193092 type:complete len:112 (-) comp16973_c0_seq9:361-696(-)
MFQHLLTTIKPQLIEEFTARVERTCQQVFEDKFHADKAVSTLSPTKQVKFNNSNVTYRKLLHIRMEMPVRRGGLGILLLPSVPMPPAPSILASTTRISGLTSRLVPGSYMC